MRSLQIHFPHLGAPLCEEKARWEKEIKSKNPKKPIKPGLFRVTHPSGHFIPEWCVCGTGGAPVIHPCTLWVSSAQHLGHVRVSVPKGHPALAGARWHFCVPAILWLSPFHHTSLVPGTPISWLVHILCSSTCCSVSALPLSRDLALGPQLSAPLRTFPPIHVLPSSSSIIFPHAPIPIFNSTETDLFACCFGHDDIWHDPRRWLLGMP